MRINLNTQPICWSESQAIEFRLMLITKLLISMIYGKNVASSHWFVTKLIDFMISYSYLERMSK